ncbi:MAG TPA: hypothetical protein VG890_11745, partial [Puia sp.]|nr:hypothetical protein [Puia sp.]
SADGEPWTATTHDMARSKTWRWGEEGLGGISDAHLQLCLAVSLWNTKDPILKERLFGLGNPDGNHGEDVKELYYYLDALPSHAYLKMLYKYPQEAFPYDQLVRENQRRSRNEPEYEMLDTGVFDEKKYFDVFIEYAKASADDILMKITVFNRGGSPAPLHVLPTLWFRNTWAWGYDNGSERPVMDIHQGHAISIHHPALGNMTLYAESPDNLLFCENETNTEKLYDASSPHRFYKDGINDFITQRSATINPANTGTKSAVHYQRTILPGRPEVFRLRLSNTRHHRPFDDFEKIFNQRITEANQFYQELQQSIPDEERKMIHRQAMAGMIWSKQYYYFNVRKWLSGDPAGPVPAPERLKGRDHQWVHLNASDVILMPDTWEYPWFAAWDLAFHCISFAELDCGFAKQQLTLLTHEWYQHPSGQIPAYEWSFSDVNPPVHAWATWKVYELDKEKNGKGDYQFLETIFLKLLLNFTWWVNRKDAEGNNIFEGGFLGMDNIGLFDRNAVLPDGSLLEQSDSTSWMSMYSLNMMRIALELARTNPVYQDMATKFFEHFLYIAYAMAGLGENNNDLWDEEDEFFYDVLKRPGCAPQKLKLRSMVGLIPLLAVEVIEDQLLNEQTVFAERLRWFLTNQPKMASLVSRWGEKGRDEKHLLSLLRGHRMKRLLYRMLDETEFLSDHGIRTLSKYHEAHPYTLQIDGVHFSVQYTPAESDAPIFGGNSNWRGPVWVQTNYMIIESLNRFHDYYGDDFKVEYPTHSGNYFSLKEIAGKLSERLVSLFTRDGRGNRPIYGNNPVLQTDPYFRDYILFFEYFHGDNGLGLGASHQTGWTALVARLLHRG